MCCANTSYTEEEINGTCPSCWADTVDGEAYAACAYSPILCDVCGAAPCDQSC